jgi:nuclear pore complex protein Nup160
MLHAASGRALGNLHEMSSTLLDILSVDSFNNGLPKYYQHILSVFEHARSFSHVADFASFALQALERDTQKAEHDPDYANLRSDLLSRLFHASQKTCQFDKAYSALSRYTNLALQKSALSSLITSILSASGPGSAGLEQLLRFPLLLNPTLSSHVDEILSSLAQKQTSFISSLEPDWEGNNNTPDYHRILHAYRIARNDFRGAAVLGYQTVRRLRNARDAPSTQLALARRVKDEGLDTNRMVEEDDLESKEIRHELLSLINLLACVDKNEAYILVEIDGSPEPAGAITTSEAGSPRQQQQQQRQEGDDVFMEDATSNNKSPPVASNGGGGLLAFFGGSNRRGSSGSSVTAAPPPNNKNTNHQQHPPRRVVVTLDHLRREYQAELDRVSRIQRGDWEFGAVEGSEDQDQDQDMDDTLLVDI